MSTIHVEAQISRESLLKAIAQLSPPELDALVDEIGTLRAQRGPSRLTSVESQLLTRINQALPTDLDLRYSDLIARRRHEAAHALKSTKSCYSSPTRRSACKQIESRRWRSWRGYGELRLPP